MTTNGAGLNGDQAVQRIPRITLGFMFLAALLLGGCSHPEQPPNILLITMDTTRADYIGCYGMTDVKTPNIDAVAAAGTRFAHNVAPSQCTNPAHSSILTGLYLARHGVYDNESALPAAANTLAEILKAQGYHTLAAVSARHLNPGNSGFDQGFDRFLTCSAVAISAEERNRDFLPALEAAADSGGFFAWVHYFDPHTPYEPRPPFDTMYPAGNEFEPVPYVKSMGRQALRDENGMVDPDRIIPLYKGEISAMDAQIGRILAMLDGKGLSDRTLVILIGDHGESMVEKGIRFCHAGLYNQVTHVPLIMRLPGKVPSGHVVEALTSSVDVVPTVLELVGLKPLDSVSGVSLVPTFQHPVAQIHRYVISEAVRGVIRCIYDGEFKFIKPYPHDWAMPEKHLYRTFSGDYFEAHDLKETDPGKAAELEHILDAKVQAARAAALPQHESGKVDQATREALRSLGYIH